MKKKSGKQKQIRNKPVTKTACVPRINLPAPYINASYDALCDAFLSLKTLEEMRSFVRDLCSEQEIEEMTNRYTVARMLAGGLPYREIAQKTGMSSSTIARIRQWLRGGLGGYRTAIARTTNKV